MNNPDYLFTFLDLFFMIGIWMLFKLVIAINCHEDSDFIKHIRAKNDISNIVITTHDQDARYKWALKNRIILGHYWKKYHSDLNFKKFIEKAYLGELYL